MHYQVSSKDDIALLTESSVRSSQNTSKPNTSRSSGVNSGADIDGRHNIHYISPASTAPRTECEGDLDYQQFYVSPLTHGDTEYRAGISSVSSSSTSIPCEENILQRTLAIIKPDAIEYKDVVIRAINTGGIRIVNQRYVHLTPEQVSEIYEKFYGTAAFPHMVVTISISPILVLSLQSKNVVEKWKNMIGPIGTLREEWFFPYSMRTRFGLLGDIPQVLHGSEDQNDAKKENRYFYPKDIQEPLVADTEKVKDYFTVFLRPTLLLGLAEIVRTKPIDPVLSLAEWLLLHNPNQPNFPEQISLTPT